MKITSSCHLSLLLLLVVKGEFILSYLFLNAGLTSCDSKATRLFYVIEQSFIHEYSCNIPCLTLRCVCAENHRGYRGTTLHHQASSLSPLHEPSLLWRHPHPLAVGGVCCPLLETVSKYSLTDVRNAEGQI